MVFVDSVGNIAFVCYLYKYIDLYIFNKYVTRLVSVNVCLGSSFAHDTWMPLIVSSLPVSVSLPMTFGIPALVIAIPTKSKPGGDTGANISLISPGRTTDRLLVQ